VTLLVMGDKGPCHAADQMEHDRDNMAGVKDWQTPLTDGCFLHCIRQRQARKSLHS